MLRRVWQGRCRSNGQRCRENNLATKSRSRPFVHSGVRGDRRQQSGQGNSIACQSSARCGGREDSPQADKSLPRSRFASAEFSRAFPSSSRPIVREAVAAFCHVPRAPEIDGVTAHAQPSSDLTRRQASGQQQHHSASEDEPLRRGPRANPSFERGAVAAGNERWVDVDGAGQTLVARFVRRSAHVSKLVVHVAQRRGSKGALVLSIRAVSRKAVSGLFVRFRGAVKRYLQADFRPVGRSRPR